MHIEGSTSKIGKISSEAGARPDGNEISAGQRLSEAGYDVTHRQPLSDKGIPGPTSDLRVDGVGAVDVYTPETLNLESIVRKIEKKSTQAMVF